MSSAVDICNIALSHLGDSATVASIDPPEGSVQAEHCARFYPISRDALLQMHSWNFITRRQVLALLVDEMDQWDYVYAWPSGALEILSVLEYEVEGDYATPSAQIRSEYLTASGTILDRGAYTPQPFHVETLASGAKVICTNQENALARYTVKITDTTLFPPLFAEALSWHLASKLAGPLLKGKTGMDMAAQCMRMFMLHSAQAKASDSNSRDIKPPHIVSWIAAR